MKRLLWATLGLGALTIARFAGAQGAPPAPSASAVPSGAPAIVPTPPRKVSAADEAKAKELFLAGNAAYKQTDYAGALTAFRAAYKLNARPGVLFSMAQTLRKLYVLKGDIRHLREAETAYRQYLADVAEGGRRADAVTALGEIDPILRAQNVQPMPVQVAPTQTLTQVAVASQADVDITVSVDGAAPVKSSVVQVTPGKHTLVISAEGYFEEKRVVDVPAGALQSVDVPLKEKPANLAVKGADGAEVLVDGRLMGRAGERVDIPHGPHLVTLIQNGHQAYQEEMEFERGTAKELKVKLDPTTQRKVSYGLFGAGAAGIASGAVLMGLAFFEQSRAETILARMQTENILNDDLQTYRGAVQNRDDLRLASGIAFGVSGAVLATGFFLFGFDRPTLEGPQRRLLPTPQGPKPAGPAMEVSLTPVLGPGIGGAVLRGRF
jgi:hypothetical protein